MTATGDDILDLDRLRRQDPDHFARFVKVHERRILALARSMGLPPADQDDAAAETFAAAYRTLPSFRGDAELSTWLYRIAYRTILKVRVRYKQKWANTAAVPEPTDTQAPDPGTQAHQDETARAVWLAVAKLDPDQAVAIELFYRRGLSVDDVAGIMGKPQGTIKTLLFRAREKLKFLLGSLENA